MKDLKGKTAFITGGASGMGLGIAKACAKEGVNVVLVDMRQSALDEALPIFKENGWPAIALKLDVTDREAYAKAVDEAEAAFGNIHILVNNAGIGCAAGPLWKVTFGEIDLALNINLTAIINGIRIVVPRMLAHGEGGHVVSTASKAGLIPVPGCGLYNTTKQALIAVMETLAMDLQGTNIGSSVFCPGPFATNLGMSSFEVTAALLDEDLRSPPPPPPPPPPPMEEGAPNPMADFFKEIRSADEAGERVLRGIKRGDLYILTHSEFKDGYAARANAIIRAFPDEPPSEGFCKTFPFLISNPIFDTQTQVPALNGPQEASD